MTGWRGIFLGALALTALEFVLSSPQGTQRAGGILTGIGTLAQAFLDPTKPGIPNLTGGAPPGSSSSAPPGSSAGGIATLPTTANTAPYSPANPGGVV